MWWIKARNEAAIVSHDPSEIILIRWFDAQERVLILSMLKKVQLLNIFVETVMYFFRIFDE